MDCAIWLNRRKIFSADEIPANFDIAAIRGYFLGGSLIKWLAANGGQAYAEALSAVDPADPSLNDRLTEIFIQKKCEAPVHKADEQLIRAVDVMRGVPATAASGSYSGISSGMTGNGSYNFGWFGGFGSSRSGQGIYLLGSFSYGSYRTGSFNYGSYQLGSFVRRTWQWEWEWRYGSFRTGSFRAGSFGGAGSYRNSIGSFGYGSFAYGFGSYRGFMPLGFGFDTGSYRGFPLGGSFRAMTSDEYDEIMYRCLNMCPLNRFGYGIHLI